MNPELLRFTETHEWIGADDGGLYVVGISDHAQHELGDVTYVDLPRPGARLEQGAKAAEVESVKAASDIYAPVAGVVAAVNAELDAATELVNQEPYGAGWFFKLQDVDPASLESLMTHDQYKAFCGE
ncbi:MAG TPA: glycine cleavage system protein GcvH [Candidatus Hydrogenedentes bacterium]|nr:glycine cleavage system protein GcvH [Candidatus Hydrogenedentota bacterium]HOH50172.1 glycine cleavage system protein GcvH [Candidatus Hydrogenedentota bacterium]HPA41376.1 glycine cleavage system protein GcvH [Candidatus Hydrogenedentota bacterium]HRZ17886.1 glycine cleavage system protein GcvH [Candidatus Hydrogenedentota bacterium]